LVGGKVAIGIHLRIDVEDLPGKIFSNEKHMTKPLHDIPAKKDMAGIQFVLAKIAECLEIGIFKESETELRVHVLENLLNIVDGQTGIAHDDPHEIGRVLVEDMKDFEGVDDAVHGFFHKTSES